MRAACRLRAVSATRCCSVVPAALHALADGRILGAHWLARGELDSAALEFSRAAERARAAEKADEERLNAGYQALVGTLRREAAARAEFERIVQDLKADGASDEARFFAAQLATALDVFRGREPERHKSP